MSDVLVSRFGKKVYHETFCPYILRTKRKNRKTMDETEAKHDGFRECKFCHSVRGIAYKYDKTGADTLYDPVDDAICIRTEVGFWKILWYEDTEKWKLYHCNQGCFSPDKDPKQLMRSHFHRQRDVAPTQSLGSIMAYIRQHDENLQQYNGDYRKMPTSTATQRKYYKKAKKLAKKKSINNVYKILNQIKMEGEQHNG